MPRTAIVLANDAADAGRLDMVNGGRDADVVAFRVKADKRPRRAVFGKGEVRCVNRG